MTKKIIKVPRFLIFEETIQFARIIRELPNSGTFIFDFEDADKIDPFSLLYLSSELQRCRSGRKSADFFAKNFTHLSYAAHMGFFKAFGLEHGKRPGEAKGSSTYIPIQIIDVLKIKSDAKDLMVNPGELLENMSKELCKVLTQTDSGSLFDLLVYSLREILRNVIEHSNCHQFGFCAQYWPSLNRVSLAILDRGIGIKNSLATNPTLNINSDEKALMEAIKPGVSGKVYKGQKRKPKGEWANSGFGLYMTSNICRNGGTFFIASGSKGLYMSENKYRYLDTPLNGTAVNLTLDTSRLTNLNDMLAELRDKASTDKIASISSLGLSKSFK